MVCYFFNRGKKGHKADGNIICSIDDTVAVEANVNDHGGIIDVVKAYL